jgi:hypothetical protein
MVGYDTGKPGGGQKIASEVDQRTAGEGQHRGVQVTLLTTMSL